MPTGELLLKRLCTLPPMAAVHPFFVHPKHPRPVPLRKCPQVRANVYIVPFTGPAETAGSTDSLHVQRIYSSQVLAASDSSKMRCMRCLPASQCTQISHA